MILLLLLFTLGTVAAAQTGPSAAETVLRLGSAVNPSLTRFAEGVGGGDPVNAASIFLWEVRKQDALSACVYLEVQRDLEAGTWRPGTLELLVFDLAEGLEGPESCDAADLEAARARLNALGVPSDAADPAFLGGAAAHAKRGYEGR